MPSRLPPESLQPWILLSIPSLTVWSPSRIDDEWIGNGQVSMLILARKSGEAIAIGEEIKVIVLGIQGKQVKLGITAPDRIAVYRDEIFKRIQQENIRAAMSLKEDIQELGRIFKTGKGRKSKDIKDEE
jgi:carbon storage regulator